MILIELSIFLLGFFLRAEQMSSIFEIVKSIS